MEKLYNFSALVLSLLSAVIFLLCEVLRVRKLQLGKSQEEVMDQICELKKIV